MLLSAMKIISVGELLYGTSLHWAIFLSDGVAANFLLVTK